LMSSTRVTPPASSGWSPNDSSRPGASLDRRSKTSRSSKRAAAGTERSYLTCTLARVRIALAGFDAFYEEHGSGAPLVLVHGLGASTAIWQKVVGPLAEHFRVIAYDLRGLGRSTTPPPPYSMAQLLGDLQRLVDSLGLERFGLVGHSLGGAIVLAYALEHPERVAAVVGIAAPSRTTDEGCSRSAPRRQVRTA
jgi:pimeloyl-ACP methyl ester carboxylesterase